MTAHPAVFRDDVVALIQKYLPPSQYPTVIDPFAGVGKIHALKQDTVGVELEPEWARQHPDTIIGNALDLPFSDGSFSAVATSPTFGNRMADHHDAKDVSVRNTYKHKLGRDLSVGNSGILPWGDHYRDFHTKAWAEATRVVVEEGGRFILHMKNHIRRGEEQYVTEWHMNTIIGLGWTLTRLKTIPSKGLKYGANRDLRTAHEYLIVFDK